MNRQIKFKTALCALKKGEKPCYRAIPLTEGVTTLDALTSGAARRIGMDEALMIYICELFLAQIEASLANGSRVEVEGVLNGGLSVQGVFDAANSPWERGKHRLAPYFNAKGAMKTVYSGAVGVNITEGNRCRITSVLDTVAKTEGVIQARDDEDPVVVYAAGGTFLVDIEAEDEGVWLEDAEGTLAVRGTVTASTATTLICEFDELPEPGEYKFVVATRGGLGAGYGVSIARRAVTVTAAPEE